MKLKRKIAAALLGVMAFIAVCPAGVANATEVNTYTYNYDYWGLEYESPDAYKPLSYTDGKALGITPFKQPQGHMLGMHTESHAYEKIYHSVDSFLADYDKLASRFVEEFGECPAVFRFPGGSYSAYINPIKGELKEELGRRGFLCYDWNVSGEDSVGTPTAASIKKNIFDTIEGQKQPIVLLHDSPCSRLTAEVLPEILEKLIADGYEFRTLQYREPYQFPW